MNRRDVDLADLVVDKMFNIFNEYRHFSWIVVVNGDLGLMECRAIRIISKNIAIIPMIKNEFQSPRGLS